MTQPSKTEESYKKQIAFLNNLLDEAKHMIQKNIRKTQFDKELAEKDKLRAALGQAQKAEKDMERKYQILLAMMHSDDNVEEEADQMLQLQLENERLTEELKKKDLEIEEKEKIVAALKEQFEKKKEAEQTLEHKVAFKQRLPLKNRSWFAQRLLKDQERRKELNNPKVLGKRRRPKDQEGGVRMRLFVAQNAEIKKRMKVDQMEKVDEAVKVDGDTSIGTSSL
ncbi:unnamed protein product [Caenorhabditis sp. 36 PRJEB53466]|nr:unnamed protein product [Caenorhabditis sp. 36 PRJEB53466]